MYARTAGRSVTEHAEASKVVISIASVEDAEDILTLQRLAYESEASFYGDWSIPPLTQTIQSLREDLASSLVLKASAGVRIVGSVRAKVEEGTCLIGRLIVHPDHQGRGIGSRLLRAIEGAFPESDRFELFTGSDSEATIRLYERHGYVVTRTEQQTPAVRITFLEKPGAGTTTSSVD